MNEYQKNLLIAKTLLGGFRGVGKLCGVSGTAVQKWYATGKPPRTEYTGESNYAEIISEAVNNEVSKDDLLPINLPIEKNTPRRRFEDRQIPDRRLKTNLEPVD